MTKHTAETTIRAYREAFEAVRGQPTPTITYRGGWFRFEYPYMTSPHRERDILAMTDRLRAEKARREGGADAASGTTNSPAILSDNRA